MLYGRDGGVKEGLQNNLSWRRISVFFKTKLFKIKMYERRAVVDNFPKKTCHTF